MLLKFLRPKTQNLREKKVRFSLASVISHTYLHTRLLFFFSLRASVPNYVSFFLRVRFLRTPVSTTNNVGFFFQTKSISLIIFFLLKKRKTLFDHTLLFSSEHVFFFFIRIDFTGSS